MQTNTRDFSKEIGLARTAIARALQQNCAAATADTTVIIVSAEPLAPSRMANDLPVPLAQKRQAQAEYLRLLEIYRQGVQEMGLPANDLGVALGVFVIGNYQVAAGQNLDEQQIAAAIADLRQLAGNLASLDHLPQLARQELFEELAISGTLMRSISLQAAHGIDPAALVRARPAAQRYLVDVLGVPYRSLHFTSTGMRLEHTTVPA